MKRLLLFILSMGVATALGLLIHRDSGVVIISWEQWILEAPLWLAGLMLLLFSAIGALLVLGFVHISQLGAVFARMGRRRRGKRSRELTNRGLIAFAEGHWSQAERWLTLGAKGSEAPLLNYLTAARAAQELSATERRDRYLRQAHDQVKGAELAVGLSQAQLQLSGGQYQQCLATLEHLRTLASDHRYILKLMMQVHLALGDWNALESLLPEIIRERLLAPAKLTALEKQIYTRLFEKQLERPTQDAKKLMALWQRTPGPVKHDIVIVSLYVKALHQADQDKEAEAVLRSALRTQWQDDWIELYGLLHGGCLQKQLAHAEGWLKEQSNNPTLLLTLGRLCLRAQLWGKAQRYFESSIGLKAQPQTHAELARLLAKLGKVEESAEHYHKGLLVAAPVIPLLKEVPVIAPVSRTS